MPLILPITVSMSDDGPLYPWVLIRLLGQPLPPPPPPPVPPLPKFNPLYVEYGRSSGRLVRREQFLSRDGIYSYVLGRDDFEGFRFKAGDYIAIDQTLDLTGVKIIHIDSTFAQPLLRAERDISDGATLKRNEVLPIYDLRLGVHATAVHPGSETRAKAPFAIQAGMVLRVSVDGAPQDIQFLEAGTLQANEVVTIINAQITGALAQVGPDTSDPSVIITSNSTGAAATFEVLAHSDPLKDADRVFNFFKKDSSPSAFYGGDGLSAIVSASASFQQGDVGAAVAIYGGNPANAFINYIVKVINAETAILQKAIVSEAAGFTAILKGTVWCLSILIDNVLVYCSRVSTEREISTADGLINVSKIPAGQHKLSFHVGLEYT